MHHEGIVCWISILPPLFCKREGNFASRCKTCTFLTVDIVLNRGGSFIRATIQLNEICFFFTTLQ